MLHTDSMEEKKEILKKHGFVECNDAWVRNEICIMKQAVERESMDFIEVFVHAVERRTKRRTDDADYDKSGK